MVPSAWYKPFINWWKSFLFKWDITWFKHILLNSAFILDFIIDIFNIDIFIIYSKKKETKYSDFKIYLRTPVIDRYK